MGITLINYINIKKKGDGNGESGELAEEKAKGFD